MSEQVLYDSFHEKSGQITVTDTRLRIGGTTYAMANITSVSVRRSPPNRAPGIIIAVLSFFIIGAGVFFLESEESLYVGAGVFILGLVIAALAKGSYFMRVSSAAGETRHLYSSDRGSIDPVVAAIERAMVIRG